MASKIQRLVGQARATFRKVGEEPAFSDEMKKLKEVINTLTSKDFNLSPGVAHKQWNYRPYVVDSPSSCMEIYQCPEFSIGIFLIKPHKHMPFHDHPGMYGVMKVLFSSMTVTSYSKLEEQATPTQGVPVRCRFLSKLSLDSKSEPCVLYPEQGNIHQIQAGE
jgi:cysteamine dioxygenase